MDPDDIVARTVVCERGRERHGVGDARAGKVNEDEEDEEERSEGQNCERFRDVLGDGLGVTKAMARGCVLSVCMLTVFSATREGSSVSQSFSSGGIGGEKKRR